MKTIELEEIKKEIIRHFKKVNDEYECFEPYEIENIAANFGYLGPGVSEKYVDNVIIDGEEYEMRACWVGGCFCVGELCFKCYSLYRVADIPHCYISEYQVSKKLYSLEINEDDFPF